ncbi:hypothetical protein BOQ62_16085 [Chryseobacterium sp. CH21]|uniref:hypothetical protein n=1 Tax=Chryseobacterium sp. CH21 TaxID=713556 RepID=UPI00100B0350|nr:hypothetical protein [Chryseobacterium sp. CH21]RXM38590.1 hypothetical protein BOQ62_16085 [Chryseobacterium sp. CH21]
MSKRKLLIQAVFEQAKRESGRDTKSGIASYLWTYFEEHLNYIISDKTFIRYYEAFLENDKEVNINPDRLDKLSQYIGYESFKYFNCTFEKKVEKEGDSTTSVRFLLDGEEVSMPEKILQIIIKISNNSNFNVPDFVKKNGLGVIEFVFIALLVTGGLVFSNKSNNKNGKERTFGIMSFINPAKSYMYWNGDEFVETDSSYISPDFEVVARNEHKIRYFKRITRKDTMNVENSVGKTWYSKVNGKVEFFTMDGIDPENKRELRRATEYIIRKYSGEKPEITKQE